MEGELGAVIYVGCMHSCSNKIHTCRQVIADEVKGVLKQMATNDAHGHMMRQTRVSKVCPIQYVF